MEEHEQTLRISEAQPNVQSPKHSVHLDQTPSASASTPSSPRSSPLHEFSFTFTLHPRAKKDSKTEHSPPPVADVIDLSPASEIFFRGHLIPLHSLPGPASLPRLSTSSQGSFTLPIEEINNINNNNNNNRIKSRHVAEEKKKKKSKPFSFLGIGKKEREDSGGSDSSSSSSNDNDNDQNNQNTEKWKSRFEVIKKCARSVKALLTPGGRRQEISSEFIRQQSYSFAGDVRVSERKRGMRGRFSVPWSMRASPRHSGMLMASAASTPPRKSDATMEEMQEAIRAAIAHCKN